jgi:hypothetical protein
MRLSSKRSDDPPSDTESESESESEGEAVQGSERQPEGGDEDGGSMDIGDDTYLE